jgi:hypothetical protein
MATNKGLTPVDVMSRYASPQRLDRQYLRELSGLPPYEQNAPMSRPEAGLIPAESLISNSIEGGLNQAGVNPALSSIGGFAGDIATGAAVGKGLSLATKGLRKGSQAFKDAVNATPTVDQELMARVAARRQSEQAARTAQEEEANIQAQVDFHNAQTAHFEGANVLANNQAVANAGLFDKNHLPMPPSRFAEDVAARQAQVEARANQAQETEQQIQDMVDFHDAQTQMYNEPAAQGSLAEAQAMAANARYEGRRNTLQGIVDKYAP